MLCYCGSGLPYDHCCEVFLSGQKKPATAEQLMRSRYSAFCRKEANYLIATSHPSSHQPDDQQNLHATFQATVWKGLRIITATDNTVEFCAFFHQPPANSLEQLHENSSFIKDREQWYYLSGQQLPALKIGRNDRCYCGSDKKVKACCGV